MFRTGSDFVWAPCFCPLSPFASKSRSEMPMLSHMASASQKHDGFLTCTVYIALYKNTLSGSD